MFCPGCNHYLNRNTSRCPYCGMEIEQARHPGNTIEDSAANETEQPVTYTSKLAHYFTENMDNRYFMIGIVSGILLILSSFLPWVHWGNIEESISYNALSMLSFKWEGASSIGKYTPILILLCGVISISFMILQKKISMCGCVSFGSALLSMILTVLFALEIYLFTGLEFSYGLVVVLLMSILLTICTMNFAQGFDACKTWMKNKRS